VRGHLHDLFLDPSAFLFFSPLPLFIADGDSRISWHLDLLNLGFVTLATGHKCEVDHVRCSHSGLVLLLLEFVLDLGDWNEDLSFATTAHRGRGLLRGHDIFLSRGLSALLDKLIEF